MFPDDKSFVELQKRTVIKLAVFVKTILMGNRTKICCGCPENLSYTF